MNTGYYVGVQTDAGGWESKDVAQLTDTEIDRFVASQQDHAAFRKTGWNWFKALATWIRDNVQEEPCHADQE